MPEEYTVCWTFGVRYRGQWRWESTCGTSTKSKACWMGIVLQLRLDFEKRASAEIQQVQLEIQVIPYFSSCLRFSASIGAASLFRYSPKSLLVADQMAAVFD